MSINERLKYLLDTYSPDNVSQFAKLIGVAHTTIASMLPGSRESKPGFEIIEKILVAFPQLRTDWLIKGEEPIYKGGSTEMHVVKDDTPYYIEKEKIIVATQDTSHNTTIPVINQKAAANYLSGFQSQEYFENLDSMTMPKFMVNGGQHGVFQVVGDSMEPTFFDSEFVICNKVEKGEWERIKDFEVYVVVSQNNGVQIKRVKNRLKTKGFMRFKSDNRTHRDFSLNEDEILELWRFEWKLSPFAINRAEELYKKVDDMEEKMHDMEDIITLVMGKLNMPLDKKSSIQKRLK